MAKEKPVSYISFELEWLEKKIKDLQSAIDAYDLSNLTDRRGPKELPNGRVVDVVISTQEQQMKSIVDIMEKLQKMLPALDDMRRKEDEKKDTRGDQDLSPLETDDI